MFKIGKLFWLIILLIVGLLLVMNHRYKFKTIKGGGWSIGINSLQNLLNENPVKGAKIYSFEWLKNQSSPETKFLADPFLFIEGNISYIFFEHQGKGNANIGLLKSFDQVNYSYVGEVLDEAFHLSFPQVFKFQDDYFMLPETKQAGHILLYKAENFPFSWTVCDTLISNVKLKDPAILISDSLNLISASDDNLKQELYIADNLRGKWKKVDNYDNRIGDETRAGGNFFLMDGEWFLPFQKNNRGYGSGISFYKLIIKNNRIKFEEVQDLYLEKVDSIKWFNRGMHHISVVPSNNRYKVVFDGDIKNSKNEKQSSWKASLKYNYYDLKRWFFE
jgi:hypothetical protein